MTAFSFQVFLVLLFVFHVFASPVFVSPAYAETQTWLDQPDQMADVFLEGLTHTKKRVDILLPDLQDQVLFEELQSLAKTKKQIRIILSTKEEGLKSWQCVPCSTLESEGVDIKYIDMTIPSGYAIIDGPRTRFSSGKFGKVLKFQGKIAAGEASQLTKITKSGDYVLNFQDEFNFLWSKSSDYGDRSRNKKQYTVRVPAVPSVFFSSSNMVPVKTPKGWLMTPNVDIQTGVIEGFVEGAINYSFKTVDLSIPSLKNPSLIKAIYKAKKRGVTVRVIVDRNEFAGVQSVNACGLDLVMRQPELADECLAVIGVKVIYRTIDRREAHSKSNGYLIVDQKLVLNGPIGIPTSEEFNTLLHMLVFKDSSKHTFNKHFATQIRHAIRIVSNRAK